MNIEITGAELAGIIVWTFAGWSGIREKHVSRLSYMLAWGLALFFMCAIFILY